VFVQSRDGNTGARDPSSLGGGDTDKHLIYEGLSRVASDAVVAGAETIRGGNITGLSPIFWGIFLNHPARLSELYWMVSIIENPIYDGLSLYCSLGWRRQRSVSSNCSLSFAQPELPIKKEWPSTASGI